jgi:hypothetical protein
MKDNDNVRAAVRDLMVLHRERRISLADFEFRLEILLGRFTDVTPDQDRALREIVNDLEIVRFVELPESQPRAVDESMERLERIMSDIP